MKSSELGNITEQIKNKFPEVGIRSIEVDESSGKATFLVNPTNKSLAFLDNNTTNPSVTPRFRSQSSTLTRDSISRSVLDLGLKKDAYSLDAPTCFKKAARYYYTDPVIGASTNLLASIATKGFSLDVDDADIKSFFESWAFDVNLSEVVDWIMLDFFKIGHVTTYKVIAAYEPKVSTLSTTPGKGKNVVNKVKGGYGNAAKKNIWSKGHIPVSYTVLNPLLVTIDGNLLFDKTSTKVTLPHELTELLKKPLSELSIDEKELIKILPTAIKKAAKTGEELQLDSRLVGSVTYRKQPYERYAKPRIARLFDTLEYKNALREADLSTLDGISNYILKITIGSDEYPVTSQEELEAAAQLFNTSSKSFDVVWNHTLNIEKIVSPEISSILGKEKYGQVNDDLTMGLCLPRALLDGAGSGNVAEVALAIKGITEEINYARRQVSNWIYNEFRQISSVMGFDKFPKVRWDNGVLKDTIMYMTTISQLVDRRMLSYQTALETLNFDYSNELRNMKDEVPLVEDGVFGILGSPWQQNSGGGANNIQPVQNSPSGTPSNGRPKGQPRGNNKKVTDPTVKKKQQQKSTSSIIDIKHSFKDMVGKLSNKEYEDFISTIKDARNK